MVVAQFESCSEGGMATSLNRREFIRIATVSSGVLGGLAAADGAAAADAQGVVGAVLSAATGRLELETSDGVVAVVPARDAQLYSGAFGEIADAGRFLVGDRVAAQGSWEGSELRAFFVGSVFTPIAARVRSVSPDGHSAETTVGHIALNRGRLPFENHALGDDKRKHKPLAAGDVIDGMGWVDPVEGDVYLLIRER
jgi:hypothetical protein